MMCDVSGPPSKTNAKANKWTYDGLPVTKNLSQNSYSDNIAATQSTIVVRTHTILPRKKLGVPMPGCPGCEPLA